MAPRKRRGVGVAMAVWILGTCATVSVRRAMGPDCSSQAWCGTGARTYRGIVSAFSPSSSRLCVECLTLMQRGGRRGWAPHQRAKLARAATTARGEAKELDTDALIKYAASLAIQLAAITAFLAALDTAAAAAAPGLGAPPQWLVFGLFFGLSLRSRIFSPLDNSRPDLQKAVSGDKTGGFNDRIMPSWTPPGVFFPIMWILIVAPLRAASSLLVWEQTGHFCDVTILALMLHLCVGDTWNTVNNVERRLGAAVPGVLCVWASVIFAAYTYYQAVPLAGQLLLPTCLWITVAAALIADTWRVNNSAGDEPLYPYRGAVSTQFWFTAK